MPVFTTGLNKFKSPDAVRADIFHLRKAIFIDRLKWKLPISDDKEIDQFDHDHTIYGAVYENGDLLGAYRLIQMDQPNMLTDVFSGVIPSDLPMKANFVESSRFCIAPHVTAGNRRALFGTIARVVNHLGATAHMLGYDQVYSLSDVRFTKVLLASGVPLQSVTEPFVIDNRHCLVGNWDPKIAIVSGRRSRTDIRAALKKAA